MENKKRLGLALCGSYCTYEKLFQAAEKLADTYDLIPIMSENAAETDTRFGTATEHIKHLMLLLVASGFRRGLYVDSLLPRRQLK